MNDDAFARLVAEDVKNRSTLEQRRYLSHSENKNKWLRALQALSENLKTQITNIALDEEVEIMKYRDLGKDGIKLIAEQTAMSLDRSAKIKRFNFFVEQKLEEVIRSASVASADAYDKANLADFYRRAIEKHKELMSEYELDGTSIDDALWASLDGKWDFDKVNAENAYADYED